MSLDRVLKKVQGFIGRSAGFSGISDFKTWHQLEECAALIWRNARDFNEDGSDIFNLANEFEVPARKCLYTAMKLTLNRSISDNG